MQKKNNLILADENILKLLFKLSMPATIGMIVMALYNVVDAIFIGRGVGTLGIAGISIVFPIQMFILALGQMVGIGGASIISRSLGANNFTKANRTLGNVYSIIIVLSFIIAFLGSRFIDFFLEAFGATPAILPFARDYMQIIILGAVFFAFLVSSNSLIRSEGRAKIAMGTMIVSAGMNIILDPIFIFGFKMGIKGAAYATVISQALAVFYIIYYFSSKKSILKFSFKNLRIDFSILKEILAIGVSSFVRLVSRSIMVIILNNILSIYGSDVSIAVFGVLNRILRFAIMPIFGIAQGFQPIAGFNFGAKLYRKTKEAIKLAVIAATGISILGFLILILLPNFLMRIFTQDENLISQGTFALRIIIITLPTIGFQIIGATTFQAIGKPFPALLLSMSRQILFLIPLLLILPKFWQLSGIWIAFPIADILAAFITFVMLKKQIRVFNVIIQREKI